MMAGRLSVVAAALITAMVAACAPLAPGGTPAIESDVAIEGGTWVLANGSVNGQRIGVPDGTRITLTPGQGDHVGGSSGCNQYSAAADIDGERVTLSITGGTDMGCDPAVMTAEEHYLEALSGVTRATRNDGTLHLSGPDAALTFKLSDRVAIEAMVGVNWRLESLIVDGEETPAGDEPATLLFEEDGTVKASTGCRKLRGRYDTFGDQITFPNLRAVGDCPTGPQKQDSFIIEILGDGVRAELQGEVLRLSDAGDVGLLYTKRQ